LYCETLTKKILCEIFLKDPEKVQNREIGLIDK